LFHKLADCFLEHDKYSSKKAQEHAAILHAEQNGNPGTRALATNERGETAADVLERGGKKAGKVALLKVLRALEEEERRRGVEEEEAEEEEEEEEVM
jgi:hypothetical protein